MRVGLLFVALLVASVSHATFDERYYAPSDSDLAFDFSSDADFAEYVQAARVYLEHHRAFLKPQDKQAELNQIAPFELALPEGCEESRGGAVLVHGILDTAYAMRSIGKVLNEECYVVRAILLPGHGTRPGDLLSVTADEWLAAVDYTVRSFDGETDNVVMVGYSLGGLLSANIALGNDRIDRVVLMAPALRVTYQVLARQSGWIRNIRKWLDDSPAPLPVRYQAMPTNAVAEIIELINRYDDKVEEFGAFEKPTFMVTSPVDIAVNAPAVDELFTEQFNHPASQLLIYGDTDLEDERIDSLPAFLPKQKVLNIAHVAFMFREDDPVFGRDGGYRDCGQYLPIVPNRQVRECQQNEENWLGELGSTRDKRYLPLQRLDFNPHFDETAERIVAFLEQDL